MNFAESVVDRGIVPAVRSQPDGEVAVSLPLEQGRDEGTLRCSGPASESARMIVGGLEGAMLVTRPYGDPARFRVAAEQLLGSFATEDPAPIS